MFTLSRRILLLGRTDIQNSHMLRSKWPEKHLVCFMLCIECNRLRLIIAVGYLILLIVFDDYFRDFVSLIMLVFRMEPAVDEIGAIGMSGRGFVLWAKLVAGDGAGDVVELKLLAV